MIGSEQTTIKTWKIHNKSYLWRGVFSIGIQRESAKDKIISFSDGNRRRNSGPRALPRFSVGPRGMSIRIRRGFFFFLFFFSSHLTSLARMQIGFRKSLHKTLEEPRAAHVWGPGGSPPRSGECSPHRALPGMKINKCVGAVSLAASSPQKIFACSPIRNRRN